MRVLFVCVANAARSQMAEAFFNRMTGEKTRGYSASIQAGRALNPLVIDAMREVGIDVSYQKPKQLTAEMLEYADWVVTIGCSIDRLFSCTFVPVQTWQIQDTRGKSIEQVREIRDEIRAAVEGLVRQFEREEILPDFNITLNSL